ncbi:hypothetical protein JKP88DRAFT_189458 [Tribonema minus]|uniref:Uncharacterized protein n=1 Tax=Tribonema minus TaxID=303371 RepID=A0A835YLS9_9STRA|nr:hypothetical protein JKP88DRAFT_189458 [Tribonema minus]
MCSAPAEDASAPRSLALPPRFAEKLNVPLDQPFHVVKEGPPTTEELTSENLIKIICERSSDEETNWLAWKCLGYRCSAATGEWTADEVFPGWKSKYPQPPDLIGVTRVYSKEVDGPTMKANQALVRAIPLEHKQSLKTHMTPLGFTGFKLDELTPNRTRRAQVLNFILYYREELFGVSLEELQRRKEARAAAAAQEHIAHQNLMNE